METLNISVTKDQSAAVDKLVKEHGFANRSEFFRMMIRFVSRQPAALNEAESFFEPPPTRDVAEVMRDFAATGRYSPKFLASLEKGLAKSAYFSPAHAYSAAPRRSR